MKDDYLWDGSGEPDPEIQNLEQVLRPYRHQRPAPEMPAHTRRAIWPGLAAAAALILMALAGWWVVSLRTAEEDKPSQQAVREDEVKPSDGSEKQTAGVVKNENTEKRVVVAGPKRSARRPAIAPKREPAVKEEQPFLAASFLDAETAKHLEKAQLLFVSFRNLTPAPGEADADLAYEKEKSKKLLERNVTLRQHAQIKGNLPAEELLGSIEPLLLDIANLPDNPSADDVKGIKDLMRKQEVVATLQVYSGQLISRND